jgi:hypothetical protein
MTWSPDLSTTGASITGLTSPTYTLVADLAPDANSRQWAVSALGGTQTNVRANTAGDPFTHTIRRTPYKARPNANPTNGSYPNVPLNRIEVLTRKGVYIDSSQTVRVMNLRLIAEIPAGAELNDAVNIKAAVSAKLGLLAEEADDLADSLIKGVV